MQAFTRQNGLSDESSRPPRQFENARLADRLHVGGVFFELLRPAGGFCDVQAA